jgi:hypothetical protein
MQGKNAQLEGGQELSFVEQSMSAYLGSLLRRTINAVNTLSLNSGVAAVGKTPAPPKVDSISISGTQSGNTFTCPSEILHIALTHNQAVAKGVRYFTEVDTNSQFTQPHVFDHGTSRSLFATLPTYSSAGVQATYYLRSYAQYPGSDPCEPTVFGNLSGSTAIKMTGSSVTALLPSTGSGTASPQGQQGGLGLGKDLVRPKPVPKRSIGVRN